MPLREGVSFDGKRADEYWAVTVVHAGRQDAGAGAVDRGQALSGCEREVADDVEFRVLVQAQEVRVSQQASPVERCAAAGREHLPEPAEGRRQQPECEPQRSSSRARAGAFQADLAKMQL